MYRITWNKKWEQRKEYPLSDPNENGSYRYGPHLFPLPQSPAINSLPFRRRPDPPSMIRDLSEISSTQVVLPPKVSPLAIFCSIKKPAIFLSE